MIGNINYKIKYIFENTILKLFEMYTKAHYFFLYIGYYYKSTKYPIYLYDYRYTNNTKNINFPFRKIVKAYFVDSNDNEIQFSNEQMDCIRNIGSERKFITIKDLYLFCSIDDDVSLFVLTNIGSRGICKINISENTRYEIETSSNFFF